MEIKEKKIIKEFKEVTVAIKCDACGKIYKGKDTPDEWHTFNQHHNEWGNDSCDSYKRYEVCSAECYWSKFKECIADLKGYSNAKIDNFEIQFARLLIKNELCYR